MKALFLPLPITLRRTYPQSYEFIARVSGDSRNVSVGIKLIKLMYYFFIGIRHPTDV